MAIERTRDGRFRWSAGGPQAAPAMFHAVRRMAYASTGDRDPARLVETGRGACTAKHLLLQQLLAGAGVEARVCIVYGYFGAGLPDDIVGMPKELRAMIRAGGVPDYHNFVSAVIDDREVALDATWHDALRPLGFPVNDNWAGVGDTALALVPERPPEQPDDIIAFKVAKLAELSTDEREGRLRFLTLLTRFIEGL